MRIGLVALSQIERLDGVLWERNAKKHDLESLSQSIERYGFIDPPKWDNSLNGGKGGLVYGNGRIEALVTYLLRARESGEEPPRGIPIDPDSGEWLIPIKFGVDAKSEEEAIAIAIDHNNLTLLGSGFDFEEISKLWKKEDYLKTLSELADGDILPLSVSAEDFADYLLQSQPQELDRYQELDDDSLEDTINQMQDNAFKGIQLEFKIEDYTQALKLINTARNLGFYVGGEVIDLLKKLINNENCWPNSN